MSAQQADVVAESVAKLAGVEINPEPFHPLLRGMLMTDERPYYMEAQITGGHGFGSQFQPSRREPGREDRSEVPGALLGVARPPASRGVRTPQTTETVGATASQDNPSASIDDAQCSSAAAVRVFRTNSEKYG